MSDQPEIVEGEEIGLGESTASEVVSAIGGRWLPGVSGKRGGRPTRKREERFIDLIREAVSDEDITAILQKAVAQARDGDRWARRFLWEYAVGKPKVIATMGRQEAPVITLMKVWLAEAAGDQVLMRGLITELVGSVPVEE